MAFEVEIKAHVRDPERLRTVLEERYGRGEAFQKRDLYFAAKPATTGCRVPRCGMDAASQRGDAERPVQPGGRLARGQEPQERGGAERPSQPWRASRRGGAERLAFRLRFERGTGEECSLVTAKKKSMREGVEINEEFEFSVSDPEAFCAFAAALGYGAALEKNKIGQAWTPVPHVTIELAEVAGLGHFIEIENLVDESSAVPGAHARVRELLASLGVGEQDIEPRYYTDMLEERDKT
jgi:predicted adenylyl cyclase CyaB